MVDSRLTHDARFDPAARRICVVGDDGVGVFLAENLSAYADTTFIGADDNTTTSAKRVGLESAQIDVMDQGSFVFAPLSNADTVIVASESDARNLFFAQVLRLTLDVDEIIVRLSDPHKAGAFEDVDVETVCTASLLTEEILERLTI